MKTKDCNIIFRMSTDDKAKLQKLADSEKRTVSQVLQIMVERQLKKGKL